MDQAIITVSKSKPEQAKKQRLTIKISGGKRRRFLNVEWPTADHLAPRRDLNNLPCHPIDMLCAACKYGYAHLAKGAHQPCDECHAEYWAARAQELEDQGIAMGCQSPGTTQSDMAERHDITEQPTSLIDARFGSRSLLAGNRVMRGILKRLAYDRDVKNKPLPG